MTRGTVLGVSHLVGGTADIARSRNLITSLGFSIDFEQLAQPVTNAKRRFTRNEHDLQDMVYFKGISGPGVEILAHRGAPPRCPARMPYLPHFGARGSEVASINELELPYRQSDKSAQLREISVCTSTLDSSRDFWLSLGFQSVSADRLQLMSIVPRWSLSLALIRSESEKVYLDDIGWNCLSLLVRGLENFVETLSNSRLLRELGTPFRYTVDTKELSVVFLRGPSDELVELIEIR